MLGLNVIEGFKAKHSSSRSPLEQWVKTLRSSGPKHFVALKQTFGHADFVAPDTVFDVKGNKFRVIARVSYALQVVTIISVLTHAEYDEGGWKK